MGTFTAEVFDVFMSGIKDYRLDTLFNTSQSNFSSYLEGFLIEAIAEFTVCTQDLTFATGEFTETLTAENIIILAKIMRKKWLQKEIQDIKQMNLSLQDKDYKRYAESNNLMAKQKLFVTLDEEISTTRTRYSLNNTIDWSAWYSGNYYTP